jgi:hypothetical protein
MASGISYRDRDVWLSNQSFHKLIHLALEMANQLSSSEVELREVARLAEMRDSGQLWTGRVLFVEDDFPGLEERKFWAKVFREVAQSIFLREVGEYDVESWQAEMIQKSMNMSDHFVEAVRENEKLWVPITRITICEQQRQAH